MTDGRNQIKAEEAERTGVSRTANSNLAADRAQHLLKGDQSCGDTERN